MGEIFVRFMVLVTLIGAILLILGLAWIAFILESSAQIEKYEYAVQNEISISLDGMKGDLNMLPQYLWEQISKIIEEKTGVKIPRPKSMEEILAGIPPKDRARLLPALIPLVVDGIRQSTGMNVDASLALQEFLLGRGLGLTELDVTIEADKMKIKKTLAARKQYKEIVDHYREEMGEEDGFVDFVEKMFLFKLLQETFKDMQLPPGWSPQQVAGLLPPRSRDVDRQTFDYEDDENEEK